eukprot:506468-Amphidinium_carterae.1
MIQSFLGPVYAQDQRRTLKYLKAAESTAQGRTPSVRSVGNECIDNAWMCDFKVLSNFTSELIASQQFSLRLSEELFRFL